MTITRRDAITKMGAAAGSTALAAWLTSLEKLNNSLPQDLKGRVKHSACRWCYNDIPLEDLAKGVSEIGMHSIELIGPGEWELVEEYGLTCAMPWGAGNGIEEGFNDPSLHDELLASYEEVIPQVAEAGLDKIICFSGNRNGMNDQTGLENCAAGLQRLMSTAEEHDVTVCMELLNSKIDHPDYMCDRTEWGARLVDRVGSDHFKLLYDIYHMQIMEGDVIRTIRNNHQYIAHYHTGGVPGRNEIDETQELYYPAIIEAILETGYEGFIGQEFIPTWDDKLAALKSGVEICDV